MAVAASANGVAIFVLIVLVVISEILLFWSSDADADADAGIACTSICRITTTVTSIFTDGWPVPASTHCALHGIPPNAHGIAVELVEQLFSFVSAFGRYCHCYPWNDSCCLFC